MSLPRPFVYRFSLTDPHPFPWIRVMVSAAIGQHLYPDPQWAALRRLWRQLYPPSQAPPQVADVIGRLLPSVPGLAAALAGHRPAGLRGASLADALAHPSRRPADLRRLRAVTSTDRSAAARVRPALRFAVLGQARWDGRLSIAVDGSPRSVVVSGAPDALDELIATCEAEGLRAKRR